MFLGLKNAVLWEIPIINVNDFKNCENSDFSIHSLFSAILVIIKDAKMTFGFLLKGECKPTIINECRAKKPWSAEVAVLEEEAAAIWIALARKTQLKCESQRNIWWQSPGISSFALPFHIKNPQEFNEQI